MYSCLCNNWQQLNKKWALVDGKRLASEYYYLSHLKSPSFSPPYISRTSESIDNKPHAQTLILNQYEANNSFFEIILTSYPASNTFVDVMQGHHKRQQLQFAHNGIHPIIAWLTQKPERGLCIQTGSLVQTLQHQQDQEVPEHWPDQNCHTCICNIKDRPKQQSAVWATSNQNQQNPTCAKCSSKTDSWSQKERPCNCYTQGTPLATSGAEDYFQGVAPYLQSPQ